MCYEHTAQSTSSTYFVVSFAFRCLKSTADVFTMMHTQRNLIKQGQYKLLQQYLYALNILTIYG